ncbi:MAG: DNA-binding protein [Candidatus Competibacteraceae bacterium]|nr:DNA-binding protein [Candidatus Competibacteraceae bacterium]
MQARPPNRIDPWNLAAKGVQWQGELPLAGMQRLSAMLRKSDGMVTVSLQGGVDDQKVHFISGRVQTRIELVCQRCLGPLQLPLTIDLRLGLVRSASQTGTLPPEYDPLVTPEKDIAVSDLVEDELILAVPFAPMHDETPACRTLNTSSAGEIPGETRLAKTTQPFAALSTLLAKKRNPKE